MQKQIEKWVAKNAYNPDWKNPFHIVKTNTFLLTHKDQVFNATLSYCAWDTKPNDKFVGFCFISCPDAYIENVDPIIFIKDSDTWDSHIAKDYDNRVKRIQDNLAYQGCYKCKSLKPMVRSSQKRIGPECVRITYKCTICGHKDYDVID